MRDDGRLLPEVLDPQDAKPVGRFGALPVTYGELRGHAGAVAECLRGVSRAAVWATASYETCVAVVGAILAGVPIIPVNPGAGARDLEHVSRDGSPELVLSAAEAVEHVRSGPLGEVAEVAPIDLRSTDTREQPGAPAGATALILYTSGTSGPPKAVAIPRRAITSNIAGLSEAWAWTSDDVVVHALPLFHAHGLVIGTIGPLQLGGRLIHTGRFSPAAIAAELDGEATMMFGVPTMYHRLAEEAENDPSVARALRSARLLVSGSAALAGHDYERIERLAGQRVVQRYGMTETLMISAVRADSRRRRDSVGPPVPGVEISLRADDGSTVDAHDTGVSGEVLVRGPNLFTAYVNRPDATEEAFLPGGWFRTGDVGSWDADGELHLLGRSSIDIIKTGGFKVGAGEVEAVLHSHPGVLEAAVGGVADDDLGEKIVAWVVRDPTQRPPQADELVDHVVRQLTPYKRPREVIFIDALPRNELGKVQKHRLRNR